MHALLHSIRTAIDARPPVFRCLLPASSCADADVTQVPRLGRARAGLMHAGLPRRVAYAAPLVHPELLVGASHPRADRAEIVAAVHSYLHGWRAGTRQRAMAHSGTRWRIQGRGLFSATGMSIRSCAVHYLRVTPVTRALRRPFMRACCRRGRRPHLSNGGSSRGARPRERRCF